MSRLFPPSLFLILVLVLAACGRFAEGTPTRTAVPPTPTQPEPSPTPTADPAAIQAGQVAYSIFCVSCHGPDARGLVGLGSDLTTSAFFAERSDAELVEFVIEGRSIDHPDNTSGVAMPPRAGFPALEDDQIADIIAYLRALSAP